MTIGGLVLAFVAGALSILSPCVLPIVPVVFGAAASDHKLGPAALAAGLSFSFVAIGLFVATIGHAIGLDEDVLRRIAAMLVVAIGIILAVPALQVRLAAASGPISNWTDQRFASVRPGGIAGQFWIGLLLGIIWSPCVGPTLGAASLLAAQGRDLPQVGMTMLAFGLGAALPLLALGLLSREAIIRWRRHFLSAGHGLKVALGVVFIAIGTIVVSGYDRTIETVLVDASPEWLTDLATRF